MSRKEKEGRGTRLPRGTFSGTSIETISSGVTITTGGVTIGGTLDVAGTLTATVGIIGSSGITVAGAVSLGAGYAVANPAASVLMTFGESVYAGSSISITTGLTTCSQFIGVALGSSTVSPASVEWVRDATNAGDVTAALVTGDEATGAKEYANVLAGVSISWIAIGS